MVALCCLMVSLSDLERPTKKKSAAQITRNATLPTTIPAIAPLESEDPPWLPLLLLGGELPVGLGP